MIKLRKVSQKDLKTLYALFKNDNILSNLLTEIKAKDLKLKDERKWIKNIQNEYQQKKPYSYHLVIILDNKLIGSIGAKNLDYKNQKTEIGYWIGEPYWNKGYMSIALKQFTDLLQKKFKINRIEAYPFSYNLPSIKVLEKTGFKFEGERNKVFKKFNKFYNDKAYALTK
jgi:[ribosomal protein S5]-alanine N-acetyltransferase